MTVHGLRRGAIASAVGLVLSLLLVVTPARAADHTVTSVGFQFLLPTTVIAPGDTVQYRNADVAPHNVFSLAVDDGKPLFQSATISAGESAPVVGVERLAEGTYDYTCTLHPNMLGTIQVGGSAVALPVGGLPAAASPVPTPTSVHVDGTRVLAASYGQNGVLAADLLANGAPGPFVPLVTGLDSPLGVTTGPDATVFVSDSHAAADGSTVGRVWAIPSGGGDAAAVGTVVVDGLPNGRHNTNGLAVHGGRLYVTNGNSTDDGVAGGAPEQPLSGTLLSVPLGARGLTPSSPQLVVEARGMRNPFDVAFRPGTDEAWITVNGPDALDPFGEDTLVKVDVTGPTVDFGFPGCVYRAGAFGPEVGQNPAVAPGIPCSASHRPPEALLGLHVSADGLAFAPEGTPWAGDLLIAEYGNNPGETVAGHKVIRVPIDGGRAGAPVDVIDMPAPLDLAFGPSGLLVADFGANTVFTLTPAG